MYQYNAEVVRVVDGDTLVLDIDLGMHTWIRNEKVRLYGINTPEVYGVKKNSDEWKRGKQSSDFVKNVFDKNKEVVIITYKDKKGKYGRYIVEIYIDTPPISGLEIQTLKYIESNNKQLFSLNEILVASGLAEYADY